MTTERASTPRRFRFRISLLTALLLTTIFGMTVVIVQFWREVGPLRTEVRNLRAQTGQLTFDDPSKIHALAVHEVDADYKSWKWRVYLPKNRKYYLHVACGQIDEKAIPKWGEGGGGSTTRLESGEQIIQAAIRKDDQGNWIVHELANEVMDDGVLKHGQSGAVPIGAGGKWLNGPGGLASSGVLDLTQESFEADKPLELVRMRAEKFTPQFPNSSDPKLTNVGTNSSPQGPTDGVLIWIDERQP